MKVIAVITEPEEVHKILRHLVKISPGRAATRLLASIQLR
jgi:Arc/MetJ family transcription regulator